MYTGVQIDMYYTFNVHVHARTPTSQCMYHSSNQNNSYLISH